MKGSNTFDSKVVFFLYPHSVIKQELVKELVENEYAVYQVRDHQRLRKLISEYQDPIVFVNIDEALKDNDWFDYVKEMMESDDNSAMLGVVTYNEDKSMAEKYLMDLMIPCGYIILKLGLEQSKKIILKTLEANEAKGRRKYLRIDSSELKNTEYNFNFNGSLRSGMIRDISSVGMAFSTTDDVNIPQHTVLSDMQVKLKGKLARVSGPVIGRRAEGNDIIYVILFDKRTDPATKNRIHSFIFETLQENIDRKIANLKLD